MRFEGTHPELSDVAMTIYQVVTAVGEEGQPVGPHGQLKSPGALKMMGKITDWEQPQPCPALPLPDIIGLAVQAGFLRYESGRLVQVGEERPRLTTEMVRQMLVPRVHAAAPDFLVPVAKLKDLGGDVLNAMWEELAGASAPIMFEDLVIHLWRDKIDHHITPGHLYPHPPMLTRSGILEDFRNCTRAVLAAYAWLGLLAFDDECTQIQLTPLGRRTADQLPPHHSPAQPFLTRLHARLHRYGLRQVLGVEKP